MHKLDQKGSLVVPLVVVAVLLFSSLTFAIWAYGSRQDYKNNSDKKAAVAAEAARAEESDKKDAEFAEAEKSPTKKYKGPETYGSITFSYPKTWSAYVSETGKSTNPVDGYFHPNFVPDLLSGIAFSLRIQVVNTPYDVVLKSFDSIVAAGKSKVSAYRAPKIESVLGSRIVGDVTTKQRGTMIILPLRDKTIKVWTEGSSSLKDFNNIVLASLTFAP